MLSFGEDDGIEFLIMITVMRIKKTFLTAKMVWERSLNNSNLLRLRKVSGNLLKNVTSGGNVYYNGSLFDSEKKSSPTLFTGAWLINIM